MSESLTPQTITFYGDELIAVQHEDSTIYALFTRLCENLGLNRQAQVRRIQRHTVLNEGLTTLTIMTSGGPQAAQFLRLDLLPLWLAGIQAERVKDEIRAKLISYQREAAFVLWEAFREQVLIDEQPTTAIESQAFQQLQQIAEMGRAIVAMAEQQMEIQRQQQAFNARLDRAGQVVKGMQTDLRLITNKVGDIQVRLGLIENQLHPSAYITEAQATEISQQVKALAEALTSSDQTKNHFQGIFAELYRRFGVASYKVIRQEQYSAVLGFLEDWHKAAYPSGTST
jgi:hypothetical protein